MSSAEKKVGRMNERPTVKGMAVALVLGCILTVLVAEGILRVAMPHWREFYSGWFVRHIRVPAELHNPTNVRFGSGADIIVSPEISLL